MEVLEKTRISGCSERARALRILGAAMPGRTTPNGSDQTSIAANVSPDSATVVAIGGGPGLTLVMSGLEHALFTEPAIVRGESERDRLRAIVMATDDGNESGVQILGIGRVFPATTENVRLRVELSTASRVEGGPETGAVRPTTIHRVSLDPEEPAPATEALEAALRADLVVLGPGSLYRSVIPVLLVRELAEAIRRSGARVVLVMNLTTEPDETDGFTAVDHLLAIRRHAPDVPIHDILLNTTPISEQPMRASAASQGTLVALDLELLRALGHRPVTRDLLGSGSRIRHDPGKLGNALMELAGAQIRAVAATKRSAFSAS